MRFQINILNEDKKDVLKILFKSILSLTFLFGISFIDHVLIQTLLVIPGLIWFYIFSKDFQSNLMNISYIQSQALFMAVSMYMLIWSVILVSLGFKESIGISFLCTLLAILIALWPIYFRTKKTIVKARRFSYLWLFSIVTSLTLIFSMVSNYESL